MSEPRRNCPTILVADDSAASRELFAEVLECQGYRVLSAADGSEALDLLEHHKIDLALLDVMMPRTSGFSVCRTIKSNAETCLIPVILATGLTDTADRIQGIECGADDFLNKPVNREELLARVRSLLRLKHFTDELEHAETVLFSLALSIEAKDSYTEGHCERLSEYAVALATQLECSAEELTALRRGGIVHDMGKIAVPEHILMKQGGLTPEERKIMEQHPIIGARICAPLKSFHDVLPIIRHHHERMDGSGYPDGLKGEEIPLTARIMAVVDVYDALSTDRPYRKALSTDQVLKVMWEEVACGWWDKMLVNELEAMLHSSGLVLP
jgi:putative two-component system response regulator